jgi:hypothetical protein
MSCLFERLFILDLVSLIYIRFTITRRASCGAGCAIPSEVTKFTPGS